MLQSSTVIHRGRREEKYEIYVEDYVVSFLKEKEGTSMESEIVFYGRKEKNGRRYTIYGAGRDRQLEIFDKYELLEEIACRLTTEGPVFLVREKNGTYEVKGYDVFYYNNEEMQDYLIHRDKECDISDISGKSGLPRIQGHGVGHAAPGRKTSTHYAVSLQLGFIFVILVAIVINSANSYDKMEQLNQSAEEVFFVMENQEAGEPAAVQDDIVVERDVPQDADLQKNVQQENENANMEVSSDLTGEAKAEETEDRQTETAEPEDGGNERGKNNEAGESEETQPEALVEERDVDIQGESVVSSEENVSQDGARSGEGVEALSRNVSRYYEVKQGDTLYRISQKIYGDISHVDKICELNQITDPNNIHYGQKIILP